METAIGRQGLWAGLAIEVWKQANKVYLLFVWEHAKYRNMRKAVHAVSIK
jgi:hypothetical protein